MPAAAARLDYPARRRLGTLALTAALAGAVTLTASLCDRFDARERGEPPERVLYLPRGESLEYMSVGYRGIAADLVWIRSVMYVGRKLMRRERSYEWMEKLYRVTTDLDPHWVRPYGTGAILLSALPQEEERALALLRRGMTRNPWRWEIAYAAAQLHLLRGRRRESLRYLKLIDGYMRDLPPRGSIVRGEVGHVPRHIGVTISKLHEEGGEYREAVAAAVRQLSSTDDRVLREVGGRGYREALARLVAWELSGAAAAYKDKKRRPPESLAALLALRSVRRQFEDHLAVPLGGGLRPDPAAAGRLLERLPADPLGMEFYLRPEGTVHSRGLERLEVYRLLRVLNTYLRHFKEVRRRPARDLREFAGFVRELSDAGRLPPGAARIFGRARQLPPHPAGPGGWEKMKLDAEGLLVMPPGPDVQEFFSAPLDVPPGPSGVRRP